MLKHFTLTIKTDYKPEVKYKVENRDKNNK